MGLRQIERRFTPGEVSLPDPSSRTIRGYAAKFNRFSQDLGGFVERIDPKFFNKSAGDGWPDVLARYNHSDDYLLGTSRAGTLRLINDEVGLDYEVDIPQSRADVLELVQRGDVSQSSFAFRVPSGGDEWGTTDRGYPMRTLLTGQLVDVAPVNSPAYLDTSIGLSSLADFVGASLDEVRAAGSELGKFLPNGGRPTIIDLGSRNYSEKELTEGLNPGPSTQFPDHEEPPAHRDSPADHTGDSDCGCPAKENDPGYDKEAGTERQSSGHLDVLRKRLELEELRQI